MKDDGAGEFVVRRASSIDRFENVDRVPDAFTLAARTRN